MTDIPEGHGIIAGRSSKNARAALDAAEAAGLPASAVKTTPNGYLVPDAVLEIFHGGNAEETPTSDWKNAEIKAWAEVHGVDLGDATTKADMLDAIASANEKE